MRIVITGGAGFVGSHLCDRLLDRGDSVVCVDDLSSGRRANIAHLEHRPSFELIVADASAGLAVSGRVDAVAHLASPASPVDYHSRPIETLRVNSLGTQHALELSGGHGARFVLASTSEVYGDPLVHPQDEGYFGNVNPVGPRSVYDEAKRFAEALTAAYARTRGVDAGIVRIFNTYGPRMRAADGRVVSSFIAQALTGRPLTVYGDGSQTRSFCFVGDLVDGLVRMLDSSDPGPVNLGNPTEMTVVELAIMVQRLVGTALPIEFHELPGDDPLQRRPDIARASQRLGWAPRIDVESGLAATVAWFRSQPDEVEAAAALLAGNQADGVRRQLLSTAAVAAP
ncbi:MAG: family oxidoreductase [Jatrophihabitantaceae bacterium]|nr:family oxidoreductase [Jatrophihabitantaceae bacterium]